MAFVSINNGFYNTKAIYSGQKYLFKSAVRKQQFEYDIDLVNINGTNYVVGEGTNDIELDKTSNITQLACIKHVLNHFKLSSANIVSAMPVNSYMNKNARQEYKDMILNIQGAAGCTVYMEGMAAVLADYKWYQHKLVCLIDIGGLTINAMLVDNCNLVPDTAFSLQLGTIILENRIKQALEKSSLCNVPTYQLKYLEGSPTADLVIKEYMYEIKQALKRAEYPSDLIYRFTGGGSAQHEEILTTYFKNAYTSNNAIWENAIGLDIVGRMIYENDSLHQR